MTAPNYAQIQSFAKVTSQLQEAAIDEFLEYVEDDMTAEDVAEIAYNLAMKYRMLGAELGAQWYDICAELAGVDVEPAYVEQTDASSLEKRVRTATARTTPETTTEIFSKWLSNEITSSIRETGSNNLWRDYKRGIKGGRWARVPVGDTCAWCMMLASNGAWYVSEKTALGKTSDHYHANCNCVAVYYADAETIGGYSKSLSRYKSMYYAADNARVANANGTHPYDEELAERIARAKAEHDAKYESGATDVKWGRQNENTIVMRYLYGLEH